VASQQNLTDPVHVDCDWLDVESDTEDSYSLSSKTSILFKSGRQDSHRPLTSFLGDVTDIDKMKVPRIHFLC